MLDLVFRTCFRWKLRPRQVTGDAKYGTEDNIVGLEDQHIRAYALTDLEQRTEFFPASRLRYEAERDIYVCPAGKELRFDRPHSTERQLHYRARAKDCNHCSRHTSSVPAANKAAASAAVCMRRYWSGSKAITRPKPTKRRIPNAVCGWNRYSLCQVPLFKRMLCNCTTD